MSFKRTMSTTQLGINIIKICYSELFLQEFKHCYPEAKIVLFEHPLYISSWDFKNVPGNSYL